MSKILVTGSQGQLGRELQRIAPSNFLFTNKDSLDITNIDDVRKIFKKHKFKYLVNCAAYTNVDLAEQNKEQCRLVNVTAVKNLAEVCKDHHCRMIHISSDYVYHPTDHLPVHEDSLCDPKGVYAESKLDGENYLRAILSEHIILRTSWVYSSFGHNFVKTMLKLANTKTELNVVDDQIGSPTNARDLANAILSMINYKPEWGIYNFSNLGFISWADFAEEIFRLSGKQIKVNRIPSSQYPTPALRPFNSKMIKSKFAETFKVNLTYWKRSLAKCLEEIDN